MVTVERAELDQSRLLITQRIFIVYSERQNPLILDALDRKGALCQSAGEPAEGRLNILVCRDRIPRYSSSALAGSEAASWFALSRSSAVVGAGGFAMMT